MPSTISVGVTPRCDWARAWPTRARAPARATIAIFFIVGSFGRTWLGVRVHGVDDVLVLDVDEGASELHGRGQLLVLRGEDLLDEPEFLDGLHRTSCLFTRSISLQIRSCTSGARQSEVKLVKGTFFSWANWATVS